MLDATAGQLTREEITRDELLEKSENEVHSTTPTKPAENKKKSARISSAKQRAQSLFENPNYGESSLVEKLQNELEKLKKQVDNQEYAKREYN